MALYLTAAALSFASLVRGTVVPFIEQEVRNELYPEDLFMTEPDHFKEAVKVPVVLGVMSQCPDAILCESVFDEVLKHTSDKIDLSLTFIGKLNASEPIYGVTCKHGPSECAGNVQELCALKYEPTFTWWNFVQCNNAHGRYEVGTPAVTLECAKEAGIDWENSRTGQCAGVDGQARGKEGIQLLQESVQVTASLGVEESCTIIISGKPVCVHDETWKDCDGGHDVDDFVRQIEEEYERLNNGAGRWASLTG
ncbi:hypothetical protein K474DRAFT_1657417 [Panus rudis PR-1116 ss-1]|nr:hypothetical protein K474DRAFT_1657417 [Panus rudis PR-1116 ss-1]